MSIKLISLRECPEYLPQATEYCRGNWGKVCGCFAETAQRSVSADRLPQTWVLLMYRSEKPEIIGFYQLDERDHLTRHTDLTPFITTLFIDPEYRGGNGGEFIYSYLERGNEPSKALHSALGFTDTGEVLPFGELIFGDDETTWIKVL